MVFPYFHLTHVHSPRKGKNCIVTSFEPTKLILSRNVLIFLVRKININKCKTIILFLFQTILTILLVSSFSCVTLHESCMTSFNSASSCYRPYLDLLFVGFLICNSQKNVYFRIKLVQKFCGQTSRNLNSKGPYIRAGEHDLLLKGYWRFSFSIRVIFVWRVDVFEADKP